MSSIADKNTNHPAGKRGFFLRSSSIQKIKCSATYPFRIAGSKLSREAIKQLLESLIIKARLVSQTSLMVFYVTTFRIIGTFLSLWPLLSATNNNCDKLKVTEKELTFLERLLILTIRVRFHKSKHIANKELGKDVTPPITTEKEAEPLSPRLALEAATRKLLYAEKPEPRKQNNRFFVLFVYAGAIFIYVELLILTLALNTAPLPPGLIFMISSVLLIGYLAFKVFLKENRNGKCLKRINTVKSLSGSSTTSLSSTETKTTVSMTDNRHSRLRIRKTIAVDFSSKTLSKIKLL